MDQFKKIAGLNIATFVFLIMVSGSTPAATVNDLLGGKDGLQCYGNGNEVRCRNLRTGEDWQVFYCATAAWFPGTINTDGKKLVCEDGGRCVVINLDGSNKQYVTGLNTANGFFWRDGSGYDWVTYTGEPENKTQAGTTWMVRIDPLTNAADESSRTKIADQQYSCGLGGSGIYLGESYGESYLYNLQTNTKSVHLNGSQNCGGSIHPGNMPWLMYERDTYHFDIVISEWNEYSNTARYIWQYHSSSNMIFGMWSSNDPSYCTIIRINDNYEAVNYLLVKITVDQSGSGNNVGSYQEADMGIVSPGWYVGGIWVGTLDTQTPTLSLHPTSLSFTWDIGQNAPEAQTVAATVGGSVPSGLSAWEGADWLDVAVSGGDLVNSINTSGLTEGEYSADVTVSADGVSDAAYAVYLTVVANAVLTSISVNPSSAIVEPSAQQQFSAEAFDQDGNPMAAAFEWAISGGGSIDNNGLFTAGTEEGGPHTVTAEAEGVSGTAQVTISASLTVTSPTAGQVYRIGDVLPIQWNANEDIVSDVTIEVSVDGGIQYALITTQASIDYTMQEWKNYLWTVPAAIDVNGEQVSAVSDACRIRIRQYNGEIQAVSEAFGIVSEGVVARSGDRSGFARMLSYGFSPSSGMRIAIDEPGGHQVSVVRLDGVEMERRVGAGPREYEFPALRASGVYLLRLETAKQTLVRRVMLEK